MEGDNKVANLKNMFERKVTLKPEPIKRGERGGAKKDDIPSHSGTTNVSNIAAMFEKKKTVNMDQDKKKFLSDKAPANAIANNPFVKKDTAPLPVKKVFEDKKAAEWPPKKVEVPKL